ncbi:RNA-directed DNA polymerase, eukaryota, reverse transcriptase zinc-binding domain protein [Tanacetum coccineum]
MYKRQGKRGDQFDPPIKFKLELNIVTNILLSQELLKGYDRNDGPNRMAMKVDIQKAYDTVNWKFLEAVLKEFGFHEKMVDWVVKCITTTPFSICVIVMEVLTLIVKDKVEKNRDFIYHFGCKKVKLTHVCFADDLLMLCNRDIGSVKTLMEAIEDFGVVSSLMPNYGKSTIIFGSMSNEDKQSILETVPFKVEKLPVRYLGVPLTSKRIRVKDCKVLTDKIKGRISNWKNKYLFYAGRLQLIASVLESIHVYWPSVFLLPLTVINNINKILKSFLWGHGDSSKAKAKVVWKNICRPKSQGGLGLKDLSVINEEANDSWECKNILKLNNDVRDHIVMKIGNGEKIKVIYDNWSSIGIFHPFITQRDIYDARLDANAVVKDLVSKGVYKWLIEWISKYPVLSQQPNVSLNEHKKDELFWKSRDGKECKFSVKQAYKDLSCCYNAVKWKNLKIVKSKLEVSLADMEWNEIVESFSQIICMIFKEDMKFVKELTKELFEIMRLRLSSLKAKKSQAVLKAQLRWNIKLKESSAT